MTFDPQQVLSRALQTFDIEAAAVQGLKARTGAAFVEVVRRILATQGRVVVTGMGKSGHVGRKIAATLASTGTPAMFVHPAEASHGDLGMITAADVVLAISNSGESAELDAILPVVKRLGALLIGMTGGAQSSLARHADLVIDSGVEDFARSHPGGALGRRLLTHVADVMRRGDAVPRVRPEAPFLELMREMSVKGLGASAVVDEAGAVVGIFTDGDLRRLIEQGVDLRGVVAREVMHPRPRRIRSDALAVDAASLMEQHSITSVLVCEPGDILVGIVHIGDLMRAKVI